LIFDENFDFRRKCRFSAKISDFLIYFCHLIFPTRFPKIFENVKNFKNTHKKIYRKFHWKFIEKFINKLTKKIIKKIFKKFIDNNFKAKIPLNFKNFTMRKNLIFYKKFQCRFKRQLQVNHGKNQNALEFLNSYALKWYQGRRLTKII